MVTRELESEEWIAFFNAFSRHFRGRPVTVELVAASGRGSPPQVVARQVPLIGITAEHKAAGTPPGQPEVSAIQILLGTEGDRSDHFTHVVREPSRVRVAQVSNGTDELLFIESAAGGTTTRVDFSSKGLPVEGPDPSAAPASDTAC